jgi:hypothetical protein
VASKGVEEPALKSRFLDVSLAAPGADVTTFVRPTNARNARPTFDLAQQIERIQGFALPPSIAGLARQAGATPSSAIGLYGSGYSSLVVVAGPGFRVDRAIPSIITTETRPWGNARVITTPLVNVMAFTAGGIGYAVAGAVELTELDRVAAALVGKASGA